MAFRFLFVALTAVLSACAAPNSAMPLGSSDEIAREAVQQQVLVLDRGIAETERTLKVAYPLLKANADLCTETRMDSGFATWSNREIPAEYRDVAAERYGLSEAPKIQVVLPGTPAAKSGLQTGDTIIAMNDKPVKDMAEFVKTAEALKDEQNVTLSVLRNDKTFAVPVARTRTCNMNVVYQLTDSNINAYADGKNIFVTRGMLRFVEGNDELAVVIGHEMAHNVMLHSNKKMQNATGGALLGLLIDVAAAAGGVNTQGAFSDGFSKVGAGAYSVDFEQEADYVGLYLTGRGGYNIAAAPNFWRRMSAENDARSITVRSSHPTAPERFIALEKTVSEINEKRSKNQALVPNATIEKPAAISKKTKHSFN